MTTSSNDVYEPSPFPVLAPGSPNLDDILSSADFVLAQTCANHWTGKHVKEIRSISSRGYAPGDVMVPTMNETHITTQGDISWGGSRSSGKISPEESWGAVLVL